MAGFEIAIIEQLTDALSKEFNESYPDTLLQAPYVGPTYPFTKEKFPSIIISYIPTTTNNMGMGHYLSIVDETTGDLINVGHWRFTGQLQFKVVALTSVDRASITDQLISVLAFGAFSSVYSPFWNEVLDNDFIAMTPLTQVISPGGPSETQVPWGDIDALLYENTISVAATGEFFSNPFDGGLVRINEVNLLPYRQGQTPPKGTGDPNPWE